MNPSVRQWDVVRVRINPQDRDEHPAVVLSREEFCHDLKRRLINVLYGTTRQLAAGQGLLDVTLNGADGLEHMTLINCEHIFTVAKEKITAVVGRVTPERRRQIGRKVVEGFRLPL
jgi:mRNA-degrading endonuclease toxin of MazEF toxin-antitoxin module